MKYIWSVLLVGVTVCVGGASSFSAETTEILRQTVSCKVELEKNIFEVGEPIQFNYRCWSDNGSDFELPNDFVYSIRNFGVGLDVEEDNGKKYRFYDDPGLIEPGEMGADRSLVFTFPKENALSEVRFFENAAWAEFQKIRENRDRDAQQEFFRKKGHLQIPAGKYFVSLHRGEFPGWIDTDPILQLKFVEIKIPFEVTESMERK